MGPLAVVFLAAFLAGGASGQSNKALSIQALLNDYCLKNPHVQGCKNKDSSGVGTPNGPPLPGTDRPGGGRPGSCSTSSRLCSERPNFCVPKYIPCSVIATSQVKCEVPQGRGIVTQILQCGDGSPAGLRCKDGFRVPLLSQLLVQCRTPSRSHLPPITQLGEVSVSSATGGAGVYQCGQLGLWDPLFASPLLKPLISSCSSAGCGSVPMPNLKRPVHRGWPWVRALYFEDKIHCTATLVSHSAVLTAAHCLTRSAVSRTTFNPQSFKIELPGPHKSNNRILTTPASLHIHPRYNPRRGRQHDTAVIKFAPPGDYTLPTVCLSNEATVPGSREQVVFGLQPGFLSTVIEPPFWKTVESTRDSTCLAIGTRTTSSCADSLAVQPFQFCASHPGMSMLQGSSGGPFLMEVGTSVEEVWQVVGVLSHFSNVSACNQGHSVYNHIAEDSEWIQNCVFRGLCN